MGRTIVESLCLDGSPRLLLLFSDGGSFFSLADGWAKILFNQTTVL
jgi:hypothetical protein